MEKIHDIDHYTASCKKKREPILLSVLSYFSSEWPFWIHSVSELRMLLSVVLAFAHVMTRGQIWFLASSDQSSPRNSSQTNLYATYCIHPTEAPKWRLGRFTISCQKKKQQISTNITDPSKKKKKNKKTWWCSYLPPLLQRRPLVRVWRGGRQKRAPRNPCSSLA